MPDPDPITTRKRPVPPASTPADGRFRTGREGLSDEQIIRDVLAGNTNLFSELVERHTLFAWKLAYGQTGNIEDAREISQNAFLKAFRQLRRFRGDSRFSTWLCRIVLNESTDFGRRKRREPSSVPIDSAWDEDFILVEPADPAAGPRETAEGQELAAMISSCVRRMPAQQRTAFTLHHLHGMRVEEVAQAMGCRPGTVKAHLFRAVARLRKDLTR